MVLPLTIYLWQETITSSTLNSGIFYTGHIELLQVRMKFLPLLVILLSAAAVTTSGEQCRNLVPGLKQLMRGVDVTTLDLLPMDFVGSHGYKKPLFEFSCDGGKKFSINGVSKSTAKFAECSQLFSFILGIYISSITQKCWLDYYPLKPKLFFVISLKCKYWHYWLNSGIRWTGILLQLFN